MKSSCKITSILLKGSFVTLATALTASCQVAHVKSGAEKIRIFETEPKGCLYMGEVSTVQDNDKVAFTGGEVDMNLNTRIELRNKAFDLDANVLVFMSKNKAKLATAASEKKEKATEASAAPAATPAAGGPATAAAAPAAKEHSGGLSEKPAESVFLGTAFRCPPLIFNQ